MVTVNELDAFWDTCWICGAVDKPGEKMGGGHLGVPHSEAVGDGITRFQIVEIMNANGWDWRNPV